MEKSLNTLRAERYKIDQELDAKFGELDEESENKLALSDKELQLKLDNYVLYIQGLDFDEQGLKEHKKEIDAELKRIKSKRDWMLQGVKITMQQMDVKELKGTYYKFTLQQNPPAVSILHEDQIPAEFTREKYEIEINKKAISKALKAGKKVPGCRLIQGWSLNAKGI